MDEFVDGDFEEFQRVLSPEAQQALEDSIPEDATDLPEDCGPGFCMIECADGEFPAMRIFASLHGLVSRMVHLEGEDTVVWPFLGIPLPFSKGPNRLLMLPDGQAVTINSKQARVNLNEDDVDIQEDGFMGPPVLSISAPSYIDEDAARDEAVAQAGGEIEGPGDDEDPDEELPDTV